MTDQTWRLLTIIGGAIAAVGLYLGFATVSVPAINLSENCGSAFIASDYATNGSGSFIVAQCDAKRQDRKGLAVALLIGGAVVGGYSLSQSSWRQSPEPRDPELEAKVRARFEDDWG